MQCWLKIFFLILACIVSSAYGMQCIPNKVHGLILKKDPQKVCLDEVSKDVLFNIALAMLNTDINTENILFKQQLRTFVDNCPPIKCFTYLNIIINYAKKYPKGVLFFYENEIYKAKPRKKLKTELYARSEKLLFYEIVEQQHQQGDIDLVTYMKVIKESHIKYKLSKKIDLTINERQFMDSSFNLKNELKSEENIKQICGKKFFCCELPRWKKVLNCCAFFVVFQLTAATMYIPTMFQSLIMTSFSIYIFGAPIIYFCGDSFIQKHFGLIMHIGPAIYYLIELYGAMKEAYNKKEVIHFSEIL